MKIKELKDKVLASDGVLKIDSIEIQYSGGDIDFQGPRGLVAWISKGDEEKDDKDVKNEISFFNIEVLRMIAPLSKVAQFLGIQVEGIEPIVVEKQVIVQDIKKDEDLARAKSDYQRSENERGAEKRAYQWVVGELADKLKN